VKGSGPQLDNSTGWHHKRYEFEPEWDNEAELAVAELEFRPDDPPEETVAKLRMLEIYNKRLDEVWGREWKGQVGAYL
jgi:transcriptional adapter 2-alpha